MSVKYDLYETPSLGEEQEEKHYHARVVPYDTKDTDWLARQIHDACSLTQADVKAALVALSQAVAAELESGNRVYLEGLGYFRMTLSCPPVTAPGQLRAASVHFKSVSFQPSKELKKRLASTVFVREENKRHSVRLTGKEIDERLSAYFESHASISRREFEQLCGFAKTMANGKLNELIGQGKIRKAGIPRFPVYEPVEGNTNNLKKSPGF